MKKLIITLLFAVFFNVSSKAMFDIGDETLTGSQIKKIYYNDGFKKQEIIKEHGNESIVVKKKFMIELLTGEDKFVYLIKDNDLIKGKYDYKEKFWNFHCNVENILDKNNVREISLNFKISKT
jgi:hypothetical protein